MVLKLYCATVSGPSKFVAMILKEKNVPFELVLLDHTISEHKSAAYLDKHPFGQIPCIDDDGFILYESRAIGRYISAKYAKEGQALVPDAGDLKATALFDQASSVEQNNFHPHAMGILMATMYKQSVKSYSGVIAYQCYLTLVYRFTGGETDVEQLKIHSDKLAHTLDVYEVILSKQNYLAGNVRTCHFLTCDVH